MLTAFLVAWLACGLIAAWLFVWIGERRIGSPCPAHLLPLILGFNLVVGAAGLMYALVLLFEKPPDQSE